jgi:hypothetical protein
MKSNELSLEMGRNQFPELISQVFFQQELIVRLFAG